jgi:hypothetical protein
MGVLLVKLAPFSLLTFPLWSLCSGDLALSKNSCSLLSIFRFSLLFNLIAGRRELELYKREAWSIPHSRPPSALLFFGIVWAFIPCSFFMFVFALLWLFVLARHA